MAKTYLDLVNETLIRLRENEVGSVNESSYSKLVGKFVNDSKEYVENAWVWNALVNPVYVSLSADVREYTLSIPPESVLVQRPDNPNRSMAYDVSAAFGNGESGGYELCELPQLEMERRRAEFSGVFQRVNQPTMFGVSYGADAITVILAEYPTQVRVWALWFKQPQSELVLDTDVISVPWRPVMMYALMQALHERGEEIGEPGNLAQTEADRYLADAVAMDLRNRRWLVDAY